MAIYSPYTYLIGWSRLNTWYYGVRYARKSQCLYESGCHPDELWVTYFTSSKHVKDFREKHGEPDVIQVRKTFPSDSSKSQEDEKELARSALLWEEKILIRVGAIHKDMWINKSIAGHFRTTESNPNPLKGKTYEEVYGVEKSEEWKHATSIASQKFWNSDAGKERKKYLSENISENFTTLGIEPVCKIKDTFIHVCEICGEFNKRRKTAGELKKKTCGSKSCAIKWFYKYNPEAAKSKMPPTKFTTIGHEPVNKITDTFLWKCVVCGVSCVKRDTIKNRNKITCGKSCAATYNNRKRVENGYTKQGSTYKHKGKKFLITNGYETALLEKGDQIPQGWESGRHWKPKG
jgi:hypothetical protein